MKIIVEVGAHTAIETLNFLADGESYVYAFEPDHELFRDLQVLSRQRPRLTALPFAVDIGDNQEPLFHLPNGQSTLAPPYFSGTNPSGFTMSWTIRLDTFMFLYGIDTIDYLRIDAPLREEMCLESLGNRVKDVQRGRIRQYETPSPVPAWLNDNGFSIGQDTLSNNTLTPDIRFWR
jgi:hypothetical protein